MLIVLPFMYSSSTIRLQKKKNDSPMVISNDKKKYTFRFPKWEKYKKKAKEKCLNVCKIGYRAYIDDA